MQDFVYTCTCDARLCSYMYIVAGGMDARLCSYL